MNNNLNDLIISKFNLSTNALGRLLKTILIKILSRLIYAKRIDEFIKTNEHLDEKQFIGSLFDDLNFSYTVSNIDHEKIPSQGRVICVANHPIGSLDALSILKAVLEVRRDVKIIANEVLSYIHPLKNLFIPLKLDTKIPQKESIVAIQRAINNEMAIIIFPAATVSRLKGLTIVDSKWHNGAVRLANKYSVPVLPIYIEARNSYLFYFVSLISKKLSTLLLSHELFNKTNKRIHLKIGDVIPAKVFSTQIIDDDSQTKLLKKHVYQIGRNRKGIYSTEKNVIHPIDRKLIKAELMNSKLLGLTHDNKKIFLTNKASSPNTINEIARLRELTFRKVGEGTGKKLDLDKFDSHYSHLIVWDDAELEIIGAYRIGSGKYIMEKLGQDGFYTSTLFDYSSEFQSRFLDESIELGRSFVQSKYWNSNALNYLWQGIGAYLKYDTSVKYLFGGVSISNNYPLEAKELIVNYFSKWYGDNTKLVNSKQKFVVSQYSLTIRNKLFNGATAKEDYRTLKNMLKPLGYTVPVLYKHYADLCEIGGVKFLDFGTDPDFENCIDGLILVDVNQIKEEKRKKYINSNSYSRLKATA